MDSQQDVGTGNGRAQAGQAVEHLIKRDDDPVRTAEQPWTDTEQTGREHPEAAEPDRAPAKSERTRRSWRKPLLLAVGALVVVGGLAYGGAYYAHARHVETTDDAFVDADIVQVAPRVPGRVAKVYVTDNQLVKQGQLLYEVDARDYQARLDESRAALASAEAKAESARTNVRLIEVQSASAVRAAEAEVGAAEAQVEQARADVVATEAEANRSQTEYQRLQGIAGTNAVSKQELTNTEAAYRAAAAQVEATRKRVATAEANVSAARARLEQVNVSAEKVAVGRADLATAEAEAGRLRALVAQAELNLSYTQVTAPQAGRVTRRSVEEGNYLQVGQATLALVPTTVWVTANFKETQLTDMRPGQPVTVDVDAYPNHSFKGHVDSIQRGSGARFSLLPPENATGNYVKVVQRVPVKIVLDDAQVDDHFVLGPGMSVVPEVKVR
jgi:membrane fusion protein (multidrug efflux system)